MPPPGHGTPPPDEPSEVRDGCIIRRRHLGRRERLPGRTVRMGDQEVILHYDDVPDSDITTVDGIPVTTPLRTVIDIATTVTPGELFGIVQDCLHRRSSRSRRRSLDCPSPTWSSGEGQHFSVEPCRSDGMFSSSRNSVIPLSYSCSHGEGRGVGRGGSRHPRRGHEHALGLARRAAVGRPGCGSSDRVGNGVAGGGSIPADPPAATAAARPGTRS